MNKGNILRRGVVTTVAQIDIDSSIDTVFNYISAEASLIKFLKKYGPIHAFTKAEMHKGPWSVAGAYRTLHFENGDTVREELLSFQPFTSFSYSISAFTGTVKHLADIAFGTFLFEVVENTTHVTWTYSFQPKNFVAGIVLTLFVAVYFKKYLQQGLQMAKKEVEGSKIAGIKHPEALKNLKQNA